MSKFIVLMKQVRSFEYSIYSIHTYIQISLDADLYLAITYLGIRLKNISSFNRNELIIQRRYLFISRSLLITVGPFHLNLLFRINTIILKSTELICTKKRNPHLMQSARFRDHDNLHYFFNLLINSQG